MPRRLLACIVATLVLLVIEGAMLLSPGPLGGRMTPLGFVAPLDLLAVAVAMAVGGVIARRGFRVPAVGLVVLVVISSAISDYGQAGQEAGDEGRWLTRNTGLQLVLAALVAWVAAAAGEIWARRRAAGATGG